MYRPKQLTDICRIGVVKRRGDAQSQYIGKFVLEQIPAYADIRVDSKGVCGIYINGTFVQSHEGRYANRVSRLEITSLLQKGENEVMLQVAGGYFQASEQEIRDRRGAWFFWVAARVEAELPDGRRSLSTNADWQCVSDEGECVPQVFSQVTQGEYDRFWQNAALWEEPGLDPVPDPVYEVAGEGYRAYTAAEEPEYCAAAPCPAGTDAGETDGRPCVIYDLGRVETGYVELEYESDRDGEVTAYFDYSALLSDFEPTARRKGVVERLALRVPLKEGRHTVRLEHRRAFQYIRIVFGEADQTVRIHRVGLHRSMMPSRRLGWFSCSEDVLNRMWEVGKYTLHINKQQEYESCPRNEKRFFTGDGVIEALIDYYAFGDPKLTDASLAIAEPEDDCGLRLNRFRVNIGLWDYPAWRIIMVYNRYRYFADREAVVRVYDGLVDSLEWMIGRMGENDLIFQYPVTYDPLARISDSVDYSSSFDRLGEKTYLNALFCRSLECMGELAGVMDDGRGAAWLELAGRVREAINDKLWDDKRGVYIDAFDPDYIPQDGNALSVLFDVSDGERGTRALDALRRENWSACGSAMMDREVDYARGGIHAISPAMNMYKAEARFRAGDAEGALELLRRCWGAMLRKGAQTFWEFAPNHPDECWPVNCHGWAGGCTYLLSAYVLGVRPDEPGYAVLRFEPCALVDNFAGVVPTARGLVAVRGEWVDGVRRYTLAVPADMPVHPVMPEDAVLHIVNY